MWWTLWSGCGNVEGEEAPVLEEVVGDSGNRLVATFGKGEVRLRQGDAPEVGLSLLGAPAVQPVHVGSRTEYPGAGITPWWQAGPWGLEQGFDVPRPPSGELVMELALSGAVAEVDEDGLGATLRTATGEGVRYERLAAWDERRVQLPARMEATERGVRLVVDATEAVGSVTIDPLLPGSVWTVESNHSQAHFGTSVASAGDVNGDGFDDVVVGAPTWTAGHPDEGKAFVYLGSAVGVAVAPAWAVESNRANANFGQSVASAGDVDGDGYADVIVGAPLWSSGQALLYRGSAAGLSTVAAWTAAPAFKTGFGTSVASADVNGDGYSDVIVGAPNTSIGARSSCGEAQAFLGSPAGLGIGPAWTATTSIDWNEVGQTVASAGDVNGDGYEDVVVGAGNYDENAPTAFLYLGSSTGLAASAAWTEGPNSDNGLWAASAGDVNGDGFGDVVTLRRPLGARAVARLYLGSAAGLSSTASWVATPPNGIAHSAASPGDVNGDGYDDVLLGSYLYLGSAIGVSPIPVVTGAAGFWSASAGDVNADGLSDAILGEPDYTNGQLREGQAAVYLGHRVLLDTDGDTVLDMVDLCPAVADTTFLDTDGDGVGNACDVPEVALTGIVAPGVSVTLTATGASPGETVSFAAAPGGGGAGPCPVELGGLCLLLGGGSAVVGTAVADVSGTAQTAVTVPLVIQPSGPYVVQAYIARGPGGSDSVESQLLLVDETRMDWDQDGLTDQQEGFYSTNVRDPDTDHDGLADGVDLPPDFDPTNPDSDQDGVLDPLDVCHVGDDHLDGDGDGVPDACDVCPTVVDPLQADSDGNGRGDLCPLLVGPTWEVSETTAGPRPVVSAGDVNGDGFGDVLVGEADEWSEGSVYVFYGSSIGPSDLADWSATTGQWQSYFGDSAASAGDVNGDGYSDVIVGAWGYDGGQADEGAAFLYLGSPTGLSAVPAWTAESNQAGANFGSAVASAGDVNGDGYSDVIVGADMYEHGQQREGAAFLFLGSATGLSTLPRWFVESDRRNASLGGSVASAGDVDADGYGDVLVTEAGTAWIYRGSAQGLAVAGNTLLPAFQAYHGVVAASAGDMNGDGYGDVVVGDVDFGVVSGGEVRLHYGSSAGLSQSANAVLTGGGAGDFGASVASAGDLDGDGYGDLAVGAPNTDDGGNEKGAVFVYLGSPTVPVDPAAWAGFGSVSYRSFGSSVAPSGDVFGDGTDHLLIGSTGSPTALVEGRAALFTAN